MEGISTKFEVASGAIAPTLLSYAGPSRTDLIVMSSPGGLERWTAGSVTERTLHGTKLPLLIVRPQKAAKKKYDKEGKKTKEENAAPENEAAVIDIEVDEFDIETWAGA